MLTRKRHFIAYLVGAWMLIAGPVSAQDKADEASKTKPAAEKAEAKPEAAQAKEKQEPKQKEAEPAKKQARAASPSSDGLEVVEAKAAGGVSDREAVDEASSFDAGDQVTIWAAIRNTDGDSDIKMVWFANDKEVSTVDIEVGQSWRWRTWTKSKVWAGDWKVEIQDGSGTVLETVEFSVKAA